MDLNEDAANQRKRLAPKLRSSVNSDPAKCSAKDVTIADQVVTSFGVQNQGAFELDDGTGRLCVWSAGFGVPGQRASIVVT